MATPDPAEPYRLRDCEEPACGLPKVTAGRVPAGWIQIHYAAGKDTTDVEPDRWYCCSGCAYRGLVHADIVGSRTQADDAVIRAERAHTAQLIADAERAVAAAAGVPG